jgi:hypothetical protein
MSRERELLERVLTSELWSVQEELQVEIRELLAQPEPEQEPVEDRILRWYKLGYAQAEKASKREPLNNETIEDERVKSPWHLRTFKAGIKFAEKMHGITGEGND